MRNYKFGNSIDESAELLFKTIELPRWCCNDKNVFKLHQCCHISHTSIWLRLAFT